MGGEKTHLVVEFILKVSLEHFLPNYIRSTMTFHNHPKNCCSVVGVSDWCRTSILSADL